MTATPSTGGPLVLQGVKVSNAFPLPKPRIVADAICGAPAQALAAAEEQKVAHQKDAADEQLDSLSDWEVCQQTLCTGTHSWQSINGY